MMGLTPELNDEARARSAALVAGVEPFILREAARFAAIYRIDRFDDLAQVGRLTALRTAVNWREDGGASFFTYSYLRIRWEIQREARALFNVIRVPYSKRFSHATSCVSLDAPVGDLEDGETVGSFFLSEAEDVTAAVDRTTLRALLDRLLDKLKPVQRKVMTQRFFEGKSQPEIARALNVTRQRIWQIEQDVFRQWRASADIKHLRATS